MWEACEALKDALLVLGPGIDGGKDSLSMAAKVIQFYAIVLYCIALYCFVLYCIVLCCIVISLLHFNSILVYSIYHISLILVQFNSIKLNGFLSNTPALLVFMIHVICL